MSSSSTTAGTGYRLELTPVESFCFSFKILWSSDIVKKVRLHIADTIIYYRGRPGTWFFTSSKTGEIMRKKPERLQSISGIINAFKQKSRTFPGSKNSEMRSKVATIWYMQSEQELASYIVDEYELGTILSSTLLEIVAIQVYCGGCPHKGNGVFEHKLWRLQQSNQTAFRHATFEHVDETANGYDPTMFSSLAGGRKKLIIQDSSHSAMTNMALTICKAAQGQFVCNVTALSLLAVLSNAGLPFFLGCGHGVVLESLPAYFVQHRSVCLFLDGEAPCMPTVDRLSPLLPLAAVSIVEEKKVAMTSSGYGQQPAKPLVTGTAGATPPPDNNSKGGGRSSRCSSRPSSAGGNNIRIPSIVAPATARAVNNTNNSNKQLDCSNNSSSLMAMAIINNSHINSSSNSPSQHHHTIQQQTKTNSTEAATAAAATSSDNNNNDNDNNNNMMSLTLPDGRIISLSIPPVDLSRPFSHIGETHPIADPLFIAQNKNRIAVGAHETNLLSTNNPTAENTNTTSANSKSRLDLLVENKLARDFMSHRLAGAHRTATSNGHTSSTHTLATDSMRNRQQLTETGGPKDLSAFLAVRRPISAPHRSSSSSKLSNKDKGWKWVKPAEEALDIERWERRFEEEKALLPTGSSLWDRSNTMGLTFGRCYGDYCCVEDRIRQRIAVDPMAATDPAATATTAADTSKTNKTQNTTHSSSSNNQKSRDCPFRLALKSIILARTETALLGSDQQLDGPVDSLVLRLKLAALPDSDQLYMYFARRHINRVAQACQEQARSLSLDPRQRLLSGGGFQDLDLNAVYRRLVYGVALSTMHPSRFYFAVPLCGTCYRLYSFLDAQREAVILHAADPYFLPTQPSQPPLYSSQDDDNQSYSYSQSHSNTSNSSHANKRRPKSAGSLDRGHRSSSSRPGSSVGGAGGIRGLKTMAADRKEALHRAAKETALLRIQQEKKAAGVASGGGKTYDHPNDDDIVRDEDEERRTKPVTVVKHVNTTARTAPASSSSASSSSAIYPQQFVIPLTSSQEAMMTNNSNSNRPRPRSANASLITTAPSSNSSELSSSVSPKTAATRYQRGTFAQAGANRDPNLPQFTINATTSSSSASSRSKQPQMEDGDNEEEAAEEVRVRRPSSAPSVPQRSKFVTSMRSSLTTYTIPNNDQEDAIATAATPGSTFVPQPISAQEEQEAERAAQQYAAELQEEILGLYGQLNNSKEKDKQAMDPYGFSLDSSQLPFAAGAPLFQLPSSSSSTANNSSSNSNSNGQQQRRGSSSSTNTPSKQPQLVISSAGIAAGVGALTSPLQQQVIRPQHPLSASRRRPSLPAVIEEEGSNIDLDHNQSIDKEEEQQQKSSPILIQVHDESGRDDAKQQQPEQLQEWEWEWEEREFQEASKEAKVWLLSPSSPLYDHHHHLHGFGIMNNLTAGDGDDGMNPSSRFEDYQSLELSLSPLLSPLL